MMKKCFIFLGGNDIIKRDSEISSAWIGSGIAFINGLDRCNRIYLIEKIILKISFRNLNF